MSFSVFAFTFLNITQTTAKLEEFWEIIIDVPAYGKVGDGQNEQ